MATISISDTLGVEIVSASPHASSGFGRYLRGQAARLLAGADVAGQLRTDLAVANPGDGGLRLAWAETVPLGDDGATLTIDAGASVLVGVYNRRGMDLLEDTFIGEPVKVPAGQAYVSFAIRPTLEVAGKGEAGGLSFGFEAGSEAEWRCYRPFDVMDAPVTVALASKDVLEGFIVPNTADDLKAMRGQPVGTLACVSGHGQLTVSAAVNLAAAFNPLASVDTLPKIGTLTVSGGASASVGVTATLSGEYQIRARKTGEATVRLGFHTVAGRGMEVAIGAAAGPGVTLGERDLLALLFRGPGGTSTAATEDLVAGGITAKQLGRVSAAMKAGISRKLEVAVSAAFSSMSQNEAAFLYEIDIDALDAKGAAAIDRALAGDLTAMTALEPQLPRHGISVLQSRTESLRKRTIRWRVNLVGIVNVLSLQELVRTGTVVHDHESGELVITDKMTSDRVGSITGPRQIRKLLYESAVMTLTYKAGGLDVNTSLEASQSFFFLDRDANRQRMSDYLDAVAALGLMDASDIAARLEGDDDFGKASLLLETTFDQAASERIFHLAGAAPDEDFYEEIGRRALLALVKAGDPDAYRRVPLTAPGLWRRMKDAGPPNFRFVLPPPITGGDQARQALRVAVVAADYSVIVWWAGAMALAAKRLAELRTFLEGRRPIDLASDQQFQKRRRDLEEAVAKAIRRNTATFDDPWGLVALFLASGATAAAAATVVSSKLTLFLPE